MTWWQIVGMLMLLIMAERLLRHLWRLYREHAATQGEPGRPKRKDETT